jgi:hypothetical protein
MVYLRIPYESPNRLLLFVKRTQYVYVLFDLGITVLSRPVI